MLVFGTMSQKVIHGGDGGQDVGLLRADQEGEQQALIRDALGRKRLGLLEGVGIGLRTACNEGPERVAERKIRILIGSELGVSDGLLETGVLVLIQGHFQIASSRNGFRG